MTDGMQRLLVLIGVAVIISKGGDLLVWIGIISWRAGRDTRTYWLNGRDDGWSFWSLWKLPIMFLEMLWYQQCAKWGGYERELLRDKPKNKNNGTT